MSIPLASSLLMRAAATLLAVSITGPLCAAPEEPPAPPTATEPAAKPFNGCISIRQSESARTDVTLTELKAAIGQPLTNEVVRDLVQRLGRRVDTEHIRYAYAHDRGITLVIDEYRQLEAIDLHGHTFGVEPYQGALPEGLGYTQTHADVEQRLGPTDGCTRNGRCMWYESGIEVVYGTRGCVSTVTLRRPISPGTAMVQDLVLEPRRRDGVDGFAFNLQYVLNLDAPAVVTVVLEDEHGRVPPFVGADEALGRDGRLSWTFEHEPGIVLHTPGGFIGFHEVLLEPGTRTLTPRVRVEHVAEPDDPVTWVPRAPLLAEVEMPACEWLRFGVRRIHVDQRDYGFTDGSSSPDLQWQLERGQRWLYRSEERKNTRKATWKTRTPWFRACRDDSFRLSVDDVDVLKHDRLGTMTLSTEELVAATRARTSMKFGHVQKLVLSKLEKRPDGPRPP